MQCPASYKANKDRNQLRAWLDSDLIVEYYILTGIINAKNKENNFILHLLTSIFSIQNRNNYTITQVHLKLKRITLNN